MKKIVIGIDVGISTTKIVGIDESGVVVSPIRIKATDPITSLYGAFGKYLHDNKIALSDVEQVMLTGVGSAISTSPSTDCLPRRARSSWPTDWAPDTRASSTA